MFFFFFLSPSLTLFKIGQKFFLFCRPHYLFQKYDQSFFYFVAHINFSKNRFNGFFFLNVFFSRLLSLDFGFYLI